MAKNGKRKAKKPAKKSTNGGTGKLDDRYYTQCASTNHGGWPCENLVESEVGSDMIEHGRLPVCEEHISDMVECMPGNCEATLPSGQRCNKFLPAEPGYNQLCRHHKDTVLRCHILRLPSEVRIIIIEKLVPQGLVDYNPWNRLYEMAFSLMLTCRKISSEAHSVLYESRKRPLAIRVDKDEVIVGDMHCGVRGSSWPRRIHIAHLSKDKFGFFRHLRVDVVSEVLSRSGDGDFYPVVEMFRRLLHALAKCPKGTFASIEVVAEFELEYKPQFEMVKLVVFTRVLLHSLNRAGLTDIDRTWSMNIRNVIVTDNGWASPDRRETSVTDPSVLRICGKTVRLFGIEDLSIDERGVLSSSIPSIDHILAMTLSEGELKQEATNWRNYEQLSVLCKSLLAMGMSQCSYQDFDAVVTAWGEPPADTDDNSCAIIKTARKALLDKDAQNLVRLLQGVKDLWTTFLRPLNAAASCQIDEGICDDLVKKLPSVRQRTSVELEWPEIIPPPKLDNLEAEVEDLVYEKYTVNGEVIYRLITPSVAAKRLQAGLV